MQTPVFNVPLIKVQRFAGLSNNKEGQNRMMEKRNLR